MLRLHVIPVGGLANRLRVLASALWVADALSLPLVLSWLEDHAISVPFEALFTNRLSQETWCIAGRPAVRLSNPRLLDPGAAAHGETVIEVRSCEPFSHPGGPPAYTRPFWAALRPHLQSLSPVEEVRRRVDAVARGFAPTTLGVHVRSGAGPAPFDRADRIVAGRFFAEIDRILAAERNVRIFLAADAESVVAQFRERYGSRVATADGGVGEGVRGTADNVEGLRLGLADLLLLSRTTCILGSFYSSFCELAGVIGAIPVRRIGGRPGEPGGETDFTFFAEPTWLRRLAWSVRSRRLRGSRREPPA